MLDVVKISKIHRILLVSVSVVSLSGCAALQDYVPPLWPRSDVKADLTAMNAEAFQRSDPVIHWWQGFNDEQLTALIEKAHTHNRDIRIAMASFSEARALARGAGFDRIPTIGADATYSRQRNSDQGMFGPLPQRTVSTYETGFDASWELDLFGRVSKRIAAQKALGEAAHADLQEVMISITAEVARNYMELRGAQYRLDIATRNAGNQEETYKLTQTLSNGGRATALDVSRARTQLSLTQARIPQFQAQVNSVLNRLSVLTGQLPGVLHESLGSRKALPSLPITVSVGNAQDLLQRRPDIRASERRLAAATYRYKFATTNLFPSVNVLGSIGFLATNLSNFGASALAASVSPTLSWRIFDYGRVRAEIDQADARAQAALASYENTVLLALEETQNALHNFTHEEKSRASFQQAARSAKQAAAIARQRFDSGIDDFLDVLDAERTLLDAEDALAVSEISAAQDLIAIYKALGGGWKP